MLDIRRLRIFVAVAEHGSFTAAAQRLYMTQSAVSQQMSILEREIGVPLFHRVPRGVEITKAGEVLVERSKWIVSEITSIEQEMRRFGTEPTQVGLGAFATAGVELLPRAIRTFMAHRPDVQLLLHPLDPDDPPRLLREGRVQLLLMWDYDFDPRHVDADLTQIHLADDPIQIVLPRDHPLADAEKVSLSDLAEEKWVTRLHRPPFAADAYEKMFRLAGFEPDIVFRTDDYQSLLGLVAAGIGVSLAPRLSITSSRDDVVVRPMHAPSFARRITLLTLPGADRASAVADLIAVLKESAESATSLDGPLL